MVGCVASVGVVTPSAGVTTGAGCAAVSIGAAGCGSAAGAVIAIGSGSAAGCGLATGVVVVAAVLAAKRLLPKSIVIVGIVEGAVLHPPD